VCREQVAALHAGPEAGQARLCDNPVNVVSQLLRRNTDGCSSSRNGGHQVEHFLLVQDCVRQERVPVLDPDGSVQVLPCDGDDVAWDAQLFKRLDWLGGSLAQ
jgi:hypothetical protein